MYINYLHNMHIVSGIMSHLEVSESQGRMWVSSMQIQTTV